MHRSFVSALVVIAAGWAVGAAVLPGPPPQGLTLGGPVDSSHPDADVGNTANNLAETPPSQPCPNSTNSSTAALCVRGAAMPGTAAQPYLVTINLDSYKGSIPDPVALFSGARSHEGARNTWSLNTLLHLEPGNGRPGYGGGVGYELDLNNWNCDGGGDDGVIAKAGCGIDPPVGLLITGASPHPSGEAIKITGVSTANAQWHTGISIIGVVADHASIVTDNASATDYVMSGRHSWGLDTTTGVFNGAPIRMALDQPVMWQNPADSTTVSIVGNTGLGMSLNAPGGLTLNTARNIIANGPLLLSQASAGTSRGALATDASGDVVVSGTTSNPSVKVQDGLGFCWAANPKPCLQHAQGKLIYTVGGVTVMSVDDTTGNMIIRGKLTQSGKP